MCVCVRECVCVFTSVLRSHAALELSRESTNIPMLIKQKKKRLGFQTLQPGVCGADTPSLGSEPEPPGPWSLTAQPEILRANTSSLPHVLDR